MRPSGARLKEKIVVCATCAHGVREYAFDVKVVHGYARFLWLSMSMETAARRIAPVMKSFR